MAGRLPHHLATMAYNNAWSNHRLLTACSRLSHADFVAPRTSFFPSLKATLNHIVTVDWYYVDALERAVAHREVNRDARRYFDPEEPFDECAALAAAQRDVDRRLVDLCVGLTDAELDLPVAVTRREGVLHEPLTRLLAHLFEHQIHHRGQAHAMLAGTEVPPPQLDEFFCANEAHLRAAELAELGYSEAQIWNAAGPSRGVHAKGSFDVKVEPQSDGDKASGATLGRMSLDKVFAGDLAGTGKGEMLTAMTDTAGSAGYVAIERVTGSLHGRAGSFVLQHIGTMTRGTPQLVITVVPDSGTGQLAGITGRFTIDIVDGKHFYDFDYTLPA